MYKNSICTHWEEERGEGAYYYQKRGAAQQGGTSQAPKIALPHVKMFHKPRFCTREREFSFFSPGIFSPYGDNMLDNLRDPSSDF